MEQREPDEEGNYRTLVNGRDTVTIKWWTHKTSGLYQSHFATAAKKD